MSCNDNKLAQLYEAALSGSVPTLTSLIGNDPQILERVSLSPNPETPLHISALAGHVEFTKALLTRKPELASRLDSLKCSPLHLASAEGHAEIVKALLQVDKNVCLVADAEGRIPLHLAAMRGNVDVIQQLVKAQPKSIREKVNGNYTVLHLCVQYNQLEALKLLVTLVKGNHGHLFDFRDHGGNTILHLAVMLRQSETIRYLVSILETKAEVNTLRNNIGMSALDVLDYGARDFKYLEIRDILPTAVGVGENNIIITKNSTSGENQMEQEGGAGGGGADGFMSKLRRKLSFGYRYLFKRLDDDWVKNMQKSLMVVATLTATMSFQVATNPPGGVWQEHYNSTTMEVCKLGKNNICHAGTAVFGYTHPDDYQLLMNCATLSFVTSLVVVLLAISGIPLKNKLCTWLWILAMVVSISSTIATYFLAMVMLAPAPVNDYKILKAWTRPFARPEGKGFRTWFVIVGVALVYAAIRLLLWLHSKRDYILSCFRSNNTSPSRPKLPISNI
ncbi:hypothetical protein CCACVL1_18714 [Corchorus capsularis]|uniref:PGG domain-containing protein n=1 Tax=Corchorus capsularis TaxID=210143 RepID=A0A1R3HK47_COCAP|nr:hypothetical protein CCACVL1_18714 [Corchorus capsularis]